MNIVPLTPDILYQFFGDEPPKTARGFAIMDEDKPLIAFGLTRVNNSMVLISEVMPNVRENWHTFAKKKMLVQAIITIRKMIATSKIPVYTVADEKYEGAALLIRHIGFEPLKEGVYVWPIR